MTPEQIQETISQMLEIQKELQQGQIKMQTSIAENAGDVLDVQMALRGIYARLSNIEDKLNKDEQ